MSADKRHMYRVTDSHDHGLQDYYIVLKVDEELGLSTTEWQQWWEQRPRGARGESLIHHDEDAFWFPLKPATDHHARVALAAYAESVRPSNKALAEDLDMVLAQYRGGEDEEQ